MSVLPITVIITTYDPGNNSRFSLLYQTIEGLTKNLLYPNLKWIITDDGSSNHNEMADKIRCLLVDRDVTIFNTERKGVGFAKNNALREAFKISPITLIGEDDWRLDEPLDLLKHVQLLLDYEENSIIRFGYLGGTFTASYDGYGPFSNYWFLHQGSGVYIYSGQISLRHQRLYLAVGWHKEFCTPGEEEIDFCIRYNGTPNAGKILWPAEYGCILNAGPFKNIGMGVSLNGVVP